MKTSGSSVACLLFLGASLSGCDLVLGLGSLKDAPDGGAGDAAIAPPDATIGAEAGGDGGDAGGMASEAGEDRGEDSGDGGDSTAQDAGEAGTDAGAKCVISGTTYAGGAANPANSCQSCQPSVTTAGWSDVGEGTLCGAGNICHSDTCVSGCEIGAAYYATGAVNPANSCQVCTPTASTTAWSNVDEGTACTGGDLCHAGACVSGCEIGSSYAKSGGGNPNNPCQSCQPAINESAWSNVSDGTTCGNGQVCANGQCGTQCDIGGTVYSTGALNPTNRCQSCQPGASTGGWTTLSTGTTCGTGEICNGDSCVPACLVGGSVEMPGDLNPSNPCESCQPGTSTTNWSTISLGSACGTNEVCNGSTCISGCSIEGAVYAAGTLNPSNACQECQPGVSGWATVSQGSACGTGQVCNGPSCISGCLIAGTVESAGTENPAIPCESCQPAATTSDWTVDSDGTKCATGRCTSGQCIGATTVAANSYGNTTCALTSVGAIWCWGDNSAGQFGNNSTVGSQVPVPVPAFPSGVSSVAVGAGHACALTAAGGVWCWGANSVGELGNNSTTNSLVPVQVSGLSSGVKSIAAGNGFTCAILTNGGVDCWGANSSGQVGDNSTTVRTAPVPVYTLGPNAGVRGVATGMTHTCAITAAGGAECWGFNGYGQLGNKTTTNSSVPVTVFASAGQGITSITAGQDYTCVVGGSTGALCWGDNIAGQLGNNSTTNSSQFVAVSGLASSPAATPKAIAAAGNATCVALKAGGVECWGENANGELGINSTADSLVPVPVPSLAGQLVTALAGGEEYFCAVTTVGSIDCWGTNLAGLGNSTTISLSPVEVTGF